VNGNLMILVSLLVGLAFGLLLGFLIWKQRVPKDISTYFNYLGNLDLTLQKPVTTTFWSRFLGLP